MQTFIVLCVCVCVWKGTITYSHLDW